MKRTASLLAAAAVALTGLNAQAASAPKAADAAAPVASLDPRIKYKDGERYLRDLSYALNMPREDICKELSQYDCSKDAFRIVLGGVEAENLGIRDPLEKEAMTAPIALDRVALHICTARVKQDLADPQNAVLLRPAANAGKSRKPNPAWMKQTVSGLYDTLLGRDATEYETTQMVRFYDEVSKVGRKANPNAVKDWVTLGCFAVASSTESVFY